MRAHVSVATSSRARNGEEAKKLIQQQQQAVMQQQIALIVAHMEDHPNLRKDLAEKGLKELGEKHKDPYIDQAVRVFVKNTLEDESDKIPGTTALRNNFFKKWLSNEKMPLPELQQALKQYRALTDLTRFAVAVDYLISHGNTEQEVDYSQNLHEENGGKEGKPHITLLDSFTKSLVNLAAGKEVDFNPLPETREIFPSTQKARKDEEYLYSGKTANGEGLTGSLLTGEHPQFVKAAVQAVSAAHEGKAPGMLMQLLAGSVKYIKGSELEDKKHQKTLLRKYFDEHLGEKLVDEILGHPDRFSNDKITEKLMEENRKVKSLSADECRAHGYIEQAHRKDANAATVATIMAEPTNAERLMAFIEARKAFVGFLESHGRFWDGVAEGVEKYKGADPELSPKLKRESSDFSHKRVRSLSSITDLSFNASSSAEHFSSSEGTPRGSHVSRLEKQRSNENVQLVGDVPEKTSAPSSPTQPNNSAGISPEEDSLLAVGGHTANIANRKVSPAGLPPK